MQVNSDDSHCRIWLKTKECPKVRNNCKNSKSSESQCPAETLITGLKKMFCTASVTQIKLKTPVEDDNPVL